MEIESINAISFYKEVSRAKSFWIAQRDGGVPTLKGEAGINTFFVWSSRERVKKIIANDEPFKNCIPLEIPWVIFASKWLMELSEQGIGFSLNWTGNNNPVWEESAEELGLNMEHYLRLSKES